MSRVTGVFWVSWGVMPVDALSYIKYDDDVRDRCIGCNASGCLSYMKYDDNVWSRFLGQVSVSNFTIR